MPYMFNRENVEFRLKESPLVEFAWHSSPMLSKVVHSKHLHFALRQLDPNKYSYPYHFHRNSEEVFVILSGTALLRTPEKTTQVAEGDLIFFEMGPDGAHQLYNHTQEPCVYIDIRTEAGIDICEYPDSGKLNILPEQEVFETKDKVDYFQGEESIRQRWPEGQGV